MHEDTQIILDSGKIQLYMNLHEFTSLNCPRSSEKNGTKVDTHRILHIVYI